MMLPVDLDVAAAFVVGFAVHRAWLAFNRWLGRADER